MARGGYRPGSGRPPKSKEGTKGAPKSAQLREMVMEALERNGGATYLAKTARTHPAAFLALLGKVLPTQIQTDPNASKKNSLSISFIGVQPQVAHVVEGEIVDAQIVDVQAVEALPDPMVDVPIASSWEERKAKAAEYDISLDSAELDIEKKAARERNSIS